MFRRRGNDLANQFRLFLPTAKLYYNIQDLSTLYQDAAGTNVCTAAGQRVKLALDTRRLINPADNVLDLDGASGDYASTPDSVANSITGDIDIRVEAAPDEWDATGIQTLVAKYDGSNISYVLRLQPDGTLLVRWTTDGSTLVTAVSTAATAKADGERSWVRATLDVDNGAGGYEVKFYTSPDGGAWTQLGSTITGGSTTSIFDGTALVTIGARDNNGATNRLAGRVFRAQIYNGIDGTLAADFNPADKTADGATWVSSTTGETWTQNGNARVVPSWSNYALQTTTANALYLGIRPKAGKRNPLTFTEEFDNAVWTKQANVTITANAGVAPDGTTTADQYVLGGATGREVYQGITSVPDGAITGSLYYKLKSGVGSACTLILGASTGTATQSFTPTSEWQRVTVSSTVTGFVHMRFRQDAPNGDEVLFWGAQLETGSTATAYQKVTEWYITTEGTPTTDNHVYSLVGIAGSSLFMTIPGSASALKFLHDGTGAYVVGTWQAGNVDDPDAIYTLLSSESGTANVGTSLIFDDDSGASRNDNFIVLVSNGTATRPIANALGNDTTPANTPLVLSTSYKSQSGDDYIVDVDGVEVGSLENASSPSSANSTSDTNLFRRRNATAYATALLDSLIIVDYVPSLATQNTAVGFLKRQSGIS